MSERNLFESKDLTNEKKKLAGLSYIPITIAIVLSAACPSLREKNNKKQSDRDRLGLALSQMEKISKQLLGLSEVNVPIIFVPHSFHP